MVYNYAISFCIWILKMLRVGVVGDTHGRFNELNRIIVQNLFDIIIVCGDFGYWNEQTFGGPDYLLCNRIVNGETKIYFCDGNHEDFNLLDDLTDKFGHDSPIEVRKNVFYCPRMSSIDVEGIGSILFVGGGYSVDKALRTPNLNWFLQEELTEQDLARLENKHFDVVISHTCPARILNEVAFTCGIARHKITHTQTEQLLDKVFDIAQPKRWYFGHWHQNGKYEIDHCKFELLNICDQYHCGHITMIDV